MAENQAFRYRMISGLLDVNEKARDGSSDQKRKEWEGGKILRSKHLFRNIKG